MENNNNKKILQILESINNSLQQQIIIELYRSGIPQTQIAKNLTIGAGTVNKLLKGIKKQ